MSDYTAWLVELRSPVQTRYFALDHMMDVHWVDEADDAVHFARRADAERVSTYMENLDIAICDHQWPGGVPREPVIPAHKWEQA